MRLHGVPRPGVTTGDTDFPQLFCWPLCLVSSLRIASPQSAGCLPTKLPVAPRSPMRHLCLLDVFEISADMVQYFPVMETFWFGVKLAFGLAVGFGIVFILAREVLGFLLGLRFTRAGCTYEKGEKPGAPSGWLIRDPRDACLGGGDWVL